MRKIVNWFCLSLVVLLLVSCTTGGGLQVDLTAYQQRQEDMQMAKIKPPRYVLQKKKPRIAILDIADHSGLTKMQRCELGPMATDILNNVIASIGRYEVVERAQAKKIAKELGYEESHGVDWENIESKYSALGKNIDYVIVGSVNRATVKTDVDVSTRSCTEEAEVSLSLRVIDLSSARTVAAFTAQEKQVEVKSIFEKCYITCGLIQKALEKTAERWVPVKIQQAIPIYGYISKLMSSYKDDKLVRIAYISLGTNDGLQAGDTVVIMKIVKERDPVTGIVKTRYLELGKAKVAQTGLRADESIIVIDNPDLAQKVKIGYLVRTTAERAKRQAEAAKVSDELGVFFKKLLK